MLEQLKKFAKLLFPTGKAFNSPTDGEVDKMMSALAIGEERAISDFKSISYQLLPDNDNFTADDCTQWEGRLGLINGTGIPLADRKLAILRKMNHPGDIKARQSWDYLQNSLQLAGFDVYVHENLAETPILGQVIQLGQTQLGQFQLGSRPHLAKVANSLVANIDARFVVSNNYRSTFVIGGATFGTDADVLQVREVEFRQLILKLKPLNTVAFLQINYI